MIVRAACSNVELSTISGVLSAERCGDEWTLVSNGQSDAVREELLKQGCIITHSRTASLQEIFVARVGRSRQPENA